MFFKRKSPFTWEFDEEKRRLLVDQFADKVKCEECRCWLDKHGSFFFCGAHRRPYSRISYTPFSDLPPKYFREVEVNEKGEPIKQK